MSAPYPISLVLLVAACGSAPLASREPNRVQGEVPAAETPTTEGAAPNSEPSSLSEPVDENATTVSPLLGVWGCVGETAHIAMSYTVLLELQTSGRFELTSSDVSPRGGHVVRMQGVWETRATADGPAVFARADSGSKTTWTGDMHRQQHRRDPDGRVFASQRRSTGVSTAERRWALLGEESETPQLQLDPELSTHVGRAVTSGVHPTWPRCDPGRFNN